MTTIPETLEGVFSWDDWAEWYGLMQGWTFPRDAIMLTAWTAHWSSAGYSPDHARTAGLKILALVDPLRTKEEHRSAISSRMRLIAAGKKKQTTTAADQHGECVLCRETGWVEIPWLACVDGSVWAQPRKTGVVSCSCWLGNRESQTNWGLGKTPLTLVQYQQHNPGWRIQIEDRAHEWKKNCQANAATGPGNGMDKSIGRIMERMELGQTS